MSILFLNSAAPTKIRAMQSHLLKKEDLLYLANSENISELIHKLDEYKEYKFIFKDLDLDKLKRRTLEQILYLKLLSDYGRLYKFVDGYNRKFLKLYFIHFEITMLKRILRNVAAKKRPSSSDDIFSPYFKKYSKVDFEKVSEATDLKSFVEGLKGSIYYESLSKLGETTGLFDYELCMDLIYFKSLWKHKNKFLSKKDIELVDQAVGSRADLLNIQWIYRAKRYYNLDSNTVYSLLVPIYYRLKTSDIKALVEAPGLDEFRAIFNECYYGKLKQKHFENINTVERFSDSVLYYLFTRNAKKNPNSVMLLYSYLFRREFEIESIIHIVESVNYGVPAYDNISDISTH